MAWPKAAAAEGSAALPVKQVHPILAQAGFDEPALERAGLIAAHLQDAGLSADEAAVAAGSVVKRMGVVGDDYTAQMVEDGFSQAMKEAGFQRVPHKPTRWERKPSTARPVMTEAEKVPGSKVNVPSESAKPEQAGKSARAPVQKRVPLIERDDFKQAADKAMLAAFERLRGSPDKKKAQDEVRALTAARNALVDLVDTRYAGLFDEVVVTPHGNGGGIQARALTVDPKTGRATQVALEIDPDTFLREGSRTREGIERVLNEEFAHRIDLMVSSEREGIDLAKAVHAARPGVFNAAWKQYFAVDIANGRLPALPPAELTDQQAFTLYFEATRLIHQGTFTTENAEMPDIPFMRRIYLYLTRWVQTVRREMRKLPEDLRDKWQSRIDLAESMMRKLQKAAIAADKAGLEDVEPPDSAVKKPKKAPATNDPDLDDDLDAAWEAEQKARRKAPTFTPAQQALRGLRSLPDPDNGQVNILSRIAMEGGIAIYSDKVRKLRKQQGKPVGGELDWLERADIPPFWKGIVFRRGNQQNVDTIVGQLYSEGYFPEAAEQGDVTGEMLAAKIQDVLARYSAQKKGQADVADADEQYGAEMSKLERQRVEFERSTAAGPLKVRPADLKPGDVMQVKGDDGKLHPVEVMRLETRPLESGEDYDPQGNPGHRLGPDGPEVIESVTLKDGTTFGVQTIDGQEGLFVDEFSVKDGADFDERLREAVMSRKLDDADALLHFMDHYGMSPEMPLGEIVRQVQTRLKLPMKKAQQMLAAVFDTSAQGEGRAELDTASPLGSARKRVLPTGVMEAPTTTEEKAKYAHERCHALTAAMLKFRPGGEPLVVGTAEHPDEVFHSAFRLPNSTVIVDADNGYLSVADFQVAMSRLARSPAVVRGAHASAIQSMVPGTKSQAITSAEPIARRLLQWGDTLASSRKRDATPGLFGEDFDMFAGDKVNRGLLEQAAGTPAAAAEIMPVPMTPQKAAATITPKQAKDVLAGTVLESRPIRTYEQAVAANQIHMGTRIMDWTAFPFTGEAHEGKPTQNLDGASKMSKAPTLFPTSNSQEHGNCEWCGKQPVKNFYHIKHDGKNWTLAVGSECITHFAGINGDQMAGESRLALGQTTVQGLLDAVKSLDREFRDLVSLGYGRTDRVWRNTQARELRTQINELIGGVDAQSGLSALSRWLNKNLDSARQLQAQYNELMASPEAIKRQVQWREMEMRRVKGELLRGQNLPDYKVRELESRQEQMQRELSLLQPPITSKQAEEAFNLETITAKQLDAEMEKAARKAKLTAKQAAPLQGSAGEYGTPDMLDITAGPMALFSQPVPQKGTLFAAPKRALMQVEQDAASELPPARPDLDDFLPPKAERKTSGKVTIALKQWHEALKQWKTQFGKWASQQGRLGAFLAQPVKSAFGPMYQRANVVTPMNGAQGWRVTVFGRYEPDGVTPMSGDWAEGAWVPIGHHEFESQGEAYEDAISGMAGAEFTRRALFSAAKRVADTGSLFGEDQMMFLGDKNTLGLFEQKAKMAGLGEEEKRSGGEAIPKPQTYVQGDLAEYTGETRQIAGGTFYVVTVLEGTRKGKEAVTQRRPDGSNPNTEQAQQAWKDQQAEAKRLHDAGAFKPSPSPVSPSPSPAFTLESPTGSELDAEARRKKLKAELQARQDKPLIGTQGDLGQMQMFGGGDLFAQPGKAEGGERRAESDGLASAAKRGTVTDIAGVPATRIFQTAKERHGITFDLAEAGYVLPDGTMLDFSGRADAGYVKGADLRYRPSRAGDRDWMRGQRGVDHREVEWEGQPSYREISEPMIDFMRLGAIRMDRSGAISLHGRFLPTAAQFRVLKDLVMMADGAYVDLEDDAGKRASFSVEGAKFSRVKGLITRWSNGENLEEMQALFSARKRGERRAESGEAEPSALRSPPSAVDAAAHEAATSPQNDLPEPTPAQKEAGNYAKGHVRIAGHDISIENPAGSKRRPEWPALKDHYGYFKATNAKDGDHVDVFIKPGTPADYAGPVHVIRQNKVERTPQNSGLLPSKGVDWKHAESRLIQALASLDTHQGTAVRLVSGESEKPETYTHSGSAIRPYTERADLGDLFAEEAKLIARAKAEGFFMDAKAIQKLTSALGDKGGGTEHDVYIVDDGENPIVIRSTILDSYGFQGRSPAQYLKRLEDYNQAFPALQTRLIGVSRNARGNGVIWTAQPFVEAAELKDDKRLQSLLEKKGFVRIDTAGDENIIYRHTATGAVIHDAHAGNVLVKGDELYPIDVIVTDLGTLADKTDRAPILTKTGAFDEYKVMLGYPTAEEAREAYLRNYEPGWPGLHKLTTHSQAEFQKIKDTLFTVPADRVPGVRESDKTLRQGEVETGRLRPADTHTFPDGYRLTGPGLHTLGSARKRAYHGTPHKVDRFRLDKIGTGEGNQVFGWGLYFADAIEVAQKYAEDVSLRKSMDSRNWIIPAQVPSSIQPRLRAWLNRFTAWADWNDVMKQTTRMAEGVEEARAFAARSKGQDNGEANSWLNDTEEAAAVLPYLKQYGRDGFVSRGNLYTVELLPDASELLDWDKTVGEQPQMLEAANRIMRELLGDKEDYFSAYNQMPGGRLYHALSKAIAQAKKLTDNDDNVAESHEMKLASEELSRVGVKGVRYFDEKSRNLHYDLVAAEKNVRSWAHEVKVMNSPAAKDQLRYAQNHMAEIERKIASATRNYVIFDENLVRILEENGQPVNQSLAAAAKRGPVEKVANAVFTKAPVAIGSGIAKAGAAVVEKAGLQQVLAKMGSNNLDKFISNVVFGKVAKWAHVDSGKKAVEVWLGKPGALSRLAKGTLDQTVPLWNVPREWLAAYHESQRKAAWGREKAMDVIRALNHNAKVSDLAYPQEFVEDPAWRVKLFDAMEGKADMTALPQPLQDLAERLRKLLRETGQELVRQGIMSLDTFEELSATGWMPRYTEDEAEAAGGSWLKAFKLGVKDLVAQRSTAWHVVDTTRKEKDGQYAIVSRDEGGKRNRWRFRNEQHRNAWYEDFIKGEAVTMLTKGGKEVTSLLAALDNDATRAVREEIKTLTREKIDRPAELSENLRNVVRRAVELQRFRYKKEAPFEPDKLIKDPVYAVARYVMGATHNAATMELLKQTAKQPEWVSDVALAGYTQMPDNDRFGPLAGKYVRDEIATQVLDLVQVPGTILGAYDAILRTWKAGKLVLNPGSHIRDAVGNVVFSVLSGSNPFNPGNLPFYRDAITALRDGGDVYAELIEMQVLGGDALTNEVKTALKGLLPDTKTLEKQDAGKIMRLIMGVGATARTAAGATVGGLIGGPVGAVAGAALAVSPAKTRGGYEFLAAVRQVPDNLYKTAAYLKYKAQGMSAGEAAAEVRKWFPYYDRLGSSALIKQGSRFVMPFSSFFRESTRILGRGAVERPLAMASILGFATGITQLSLMMLGLGDEDEESVFRSMRGKLKLGLSGNAPVFSMLLPTRTDEGQLQQWDISSVLPFADLLGTRVEMRQGEDEWTKFWRGLFTQSPILSTAWAWSTNTDAFSGRRIVEEDMGALESTKERLREFGDTMLPPLTPWFGVHSNTLANAGRRMSSLDTRNATQSYLRAIVGLDVRSADPNLRTETEHWRKEKGLPLANAGSLYATPLKSRLGRQIKGELIQDAPDIDIVADALLRLEESGNPIKTREDMEKLLKGLDPDRLIKEEYRRKLIQSFSPEALRVWRTQQSEFKAAQRRLPGVMKEASPLVKARRAKVFTPVMP